METDVDPDAHGKAKYEEEGDDRKFMLQVKDLSLVHGVLVFVDGEFLDDIAIEDGRGRLMLKTQHGDTVPVMTVDSIIEVVDADTEELLLVAEGGVLEHDDDHHGDDDDDDHGDHD